MKWPPGPQVRAGRPGGRAGSAARRRWPAGGEPAATAAYGAAEPDGVGEPDAPGVGVGAGVGVG